MAESPEEFFAASARQPTPTGALPMPDVDTWDTFPFEGELRVRPLLPPTESEPPRARRRGRVGVPGVCHGAEKAIWSDDNWLLLPIRGQRASGRRHSRATGPPRLPGARRRAGGGARADAHSRRARDSHDRRHRPRPHGKWGDGSYHAHVWFFAPPRPPPAADRKLHVDLVRRPPAASRRAPPRATSAPSRARWRRTVGIAHL